MSLSAHRVRRHLNPPQYQQSKEEVEAITNYSGAAAAVKFVLVLLIVGGILALIFRNHFSPFSVNFPIDNHNKLLWYNAMESTVRYPGDIPANENDYKGNSIMPYKSTGWTIPYTRWPDNASPGHFGYGGVAGNLSGWVEPVYPPSAAAYKPNYSESNVPPYQERPLSHW